MHEQYAGTKAGGQALLGGLDCTVHRNFFGAQIRSFSTKLKAPACMQDFGPDLDDFRAVFIRLLRSSLPPIKGHTYVILRIHAPFPACNYKARRW